jgi:hypothetical protein
MVEIADSRKAVAGGILVVVSGVLLFLEGNTAEGISLLVAAASAVGIALGTLLVGTSSGARV